MLNRKQLDADVCVVGGGISGICAAISAARNGAKTVLMHERSVLGGNASSEIRMWICGAHGENNRETGILEEILLENYYRNPTKNYYIWDTVLYDFVIREKNITLLLNCSCMDAVTRDGEFDHDRKIHIDMITGYQMTTQTFFDVKAGIFIDCSGDSILAPLTGADFRMGRESAEEYGENITLRSQNSGIMGMSCLIQCRETDRKIKFTPPEWSTKLDRADFADKNLNIRKSYENFWYLELGGDRDTIADTESVAGELIPLAIGTWDYIKNSGDIDADNFELDFLGFLPGKRESRRMMGEYVITQKDISGDVMFPDTIAYGGWTLDDHFSTGFYSKGAVNIHIDTPAPYQIPYRSLYSKNVDNLMFAGRNISMTHTALSSIRVMATCALLGQAAGTAAAMATDKGVSPHGIYEDHIGELQDRLMNADCFIPHRRRAVSKTCTTAELSAGGSALRNGEDRPHRLYGTKNCGIEVLNGERISYKHLGCGISHVHITFDSDLNRVTLPGDNCERCHSMRCNTYLDSPMMCMPKTLCREFILTVKKNGKEETVLKVENNRKRSYDIEIDGTPEEITLTPISNWGDSDRTRVFSFDFR